jgi:bleomycin hydrolase
MYNVRNTYSKKAWNYILRQGKAQFSEGGLAHDVINSVKDNGIVPNSVYTGLNGTNETHNHLELTAILEAMLRTYVSNPAKKLSPQWEASIESVLDVYLGKNSTEFIYEGKKYTPKSFLEMTQLKPEEYVTISSFKHEPMYQTFLLNIPDNFSNGTFYNVPLEEMVENIDNALNKGFTLSLDCDVSETTFSGKNGIAVIPDNPADEQSILSEIKLEKIISPEYRQQEFENLATTDDHLMHIVGKVKDQTGKMYYKVKNSWGTNSGKNGYIYMSGSYLRLKAISVLLHKDGLLTATKSKLKL